MKVTLGICKGKVLAMEALLKFIQLIHIPLFKRSIGIVMEIGFFAYYLMS